MRLLTVTLASFCMVVTALAQTTPQRVPQFAKFPAPVYRGPIGRVNLSSPNVYQYRTRLRDGAHQPVNFAGHYQLVQWGCGTACSTGAVIDALNGQVTLLPTVVMQGMEAAMDARFKAVEFRANSRLIVFSGQINETGVLGTHFELWNGSGFQELLTVPFVPPATEAQRQPSPPTGEEVNQRQLGDDFVLQIGTTLDPKVAGTQVMNAQYGARNDSVKEWRYIVGTGESRVEYRIKDFVANTVKTPYGERLYVLARGDAEDDGACHACPGLVGAFLLENHDGRLEMIAGSKDLRSVGEFGSGSNIEVRFQQLGNDALYGWVLEASYLQQGEIAQQYSILMPKGKTIGFVGDFPKYEDDSDSAECSEPPHNCFTVKYDLTFDTSTAQQHYPIVLQRSGTKGNRTIKPRRFRIDFDEGRGEYVAPKELAAGVGIK